MKTIFYWTMKINYSKTEDYDDHYFSNNKLIIHNYINTCFYLYRWNHVYMSIQYKNVKILLIDIDYIYC